MALAAVAARGSADDLVVRPALEHESREAAYGGAHRAAGADLCARAADLDATSVARHHTSNLGGVRARCVEQRRAGFSPGWAGVDPQSKSRRRPRLCTLRSV